MRGNTALANVLKMEGTEYLFCYPANPLIEAAAIAGIRPIMSRTERTTVNMADGFTRVSNGRRTRRSCHAIGARHRKRLRRRGSRIRRVSAYSCHPWRAAAGQDGPIS